MTHSFPTRSASELAPSGGQDRKAQLVLAHRLAAVRRSLRRDGDERGAQRLEVRPRGFEGLQFHVAVRAPDTAVEADHQRACFQQVGRSEEHTSELQSLMRISYAVFCLKKKTHKKKHQE